MSIFPTKILLATDGSSEAELATQTAGDLARMSDSELHVVYVEDYSSIALLYPEATDPEAVVMPDPILEEDLERYSEQRSRELLDAEVERVRSAGGTVAQAHLMMGDDGRGGTGDRPPGRGSKGWSDSDGQQGARGDQEGLDGQRFGLGG